MIRFKQFLCETLNSPVPYSWDYRNPDQWKATFHIGEWEYFVICRRNEVNIRKWQIIFDIENRPDSDEPFSLSGTGGTLPVFSTITTILQEFVRKSYDVTTIYFTAEEDSRKKFYNRWAPILARSLGGWKVKAQQKKINEYTLTRPR